MIFKLVYEDNGTHIDSNGERCSLLIGEHFIDSPDGLNVGCVFYDTIEEAESHYAISLVEVE